VKLLIEGRPGSGKTTAARRLISRLVESGATVAGFTTAEIRKGGRRVGFSIETTDGRDGVLAHVTLDGPRVGKYGVDLDSFEALALPALDARDPGAIVVIDEIGKMELLSDAFSGLLEQLFAHHNAVIATVHVHHHPLTDALKRRRDTEVVRITNANRDALPQEIAMRLLTTYGRSQSTSGDG
jgi:nucleoside-triphosphatase